MKNKNYMSISTTTPNYIDYYQKERNSVVYYTNDVTLLQYPEDQVLVEDTYSFCQRSNNNFHLPPLSTSTLTSNVGTDGKRAWAVLAGLVMSTVFAGLQPPW